MIIACLGLIWFAGVAVAVPQQPTKDQLPTIARVVFSQDISEVSNQDLADALAQLRERTEQLAMEVKANDDDGSGTKGSVSNPSNLNTDYLDGDSVDVEKVTEIERNIKLLQTIFKEKKRRQIEEMKMAKESANESSEEHPNEVPLPEFRSDGTVIKDSMNTAPNVAGGDIEPMPAFATLPSQAVSKIVDPFELGNSLFMRGSIEDALKFYEMVPEDQLSLFDRNWLELMKASCYRSLGRIDDAEVSYLEVANTKGNKNTAEIAKGWLKYLNTRKRMDATLEALGKKADMTLNKAEKLVEAENGNAN